MKKLIVVLMSVASLMVTQTMADTNSLFNSGELGLTISSGYDVGSANKINGKTLFSAPYDFNLSVGAFWFPWRNLGVEASIPVYNTTGVSVDEIQSGVVIRLPLSKDARVLKNISPYIGLGGAYNWRDEQNWAYVGKLGVDLRFNKKWGVFTEGAYRNYELDDWRQGSITVQGGLKLVF
jgi:opacity protein-like surface antigen